MNSDYRRHAYHEGFPLQSNAETSFIRKLIQGRIAVILFLVLTVSLTILPLIFYSWPVLFILTSGCVNRDASRRFLNWGFGVWLYMESYFTDKVLGTRVKVFGSTKEFSDKCIIIMNHRCHFDWMFFFPVICKMGNPKKWLTILKNMGKVFPGLGWAMQLRNFIFLSRRDWEKDKEELRWKLNYIKATNSDYQLLMFPEGTDLNVRSCEKSDKHAKDNNYPIYDYVLHPKTTGFKYILETLRKYQIDAVYDVAVAYPDVFAAEEKDLIIDGKVPREIHYHITKYSASSLPVDDHKIDEWIRQRWREKEERLRIFYETRRFHDLPSDEHVGEGRSSSSTGHSQLSPEVVKPLLLSNLVPGLVFCIVHLFVLGYLCLAYWFVGLTAILLMCGSLYVSMYTKGADYMIMNCNKELQEILRQLGENAHDKNE